MNDLTETLYKYRDWENEYHKRILTHNEIYFASPKEFNDPFDSNLPITLQPQNDDELIKYIVNVLLVDGIYKNKGKAKKEAKRLLNNYKSNPDIVKKGIVDEQRKLIQNEVRIFSLSKNNSNIVMWSHYSNSHKGFSIGYNTLKLKEYICPHIQNHSLCIGLFNITYLEKYPVLNRFELNNEDLFKLTLLQKSCSWRYEEEVRSIMMKIDGSIIIPKEECVIQIPNEIIDSVTLGCQIFDKHKNEIIEIVKEKKSDIKIFQCKLKDEEFGLDFMPVEY